MSDQHSNRKPFNPLDKVHLGESVVGALLQQPVHTLPPASFVGAGIYALYYVGSLSLYEPVAALNRLDQFKCPIYVGKAIPAGARRGKVGLEEAAGKDLYKRLAQHGKSIEAASNLHLTDFFCRYLVVDDIWIPLAESLLIKQFTPVWNQLIDGFGNNDPGKGRIGQRLSQWDTLHSGRSWATKLAASTADIDSLITSLEPKIRALAGKLS